MQMYTSRAICIINISQYGHSDRKTDESIGLPHFDCKQPCPA